MNLKGVLIDYGDTLAFYDTDGNRKYEEDLLSTTRNYGYRKSSDYLASVLSDTLGNSTKGELKNLREFWELFMEKLGIHSQPTFVEDLEKVRNRHSATVHKLYDGVLPVLSTLKKKYRLALVSNCAIGTSDSIESLGLTSFFESIILSYEVGARKPDRHIYVEALQGLKLKPDEGIFVADEISDLEGAKEVGLKTLLVRQGSHTTHEAKDPNFKPDFQCNHIAEITRFL